jgi:hypothetical protein
VKKDSTHAADLLIDMQDLLHCELYADAYALCQKMIAGEYRDETVRRLLDTMKKELSTDLRDHWRIRLAHHFMALFSEIISFYTISPVLYLNKSNVWEYNFVALVPQ